MRKQLIGILLGIACVSALAACNSTPPTPDSDNGTGGVEHTHTLSYTAEREATCAFEGNAAYWSCDCGAVFADENGATETTWAAVKIAKEEHTLEHTFGIKATCQKGGLQEHWTCTTCATSFADEACTETIRLSQTILSKTAHDLDRKSVV